MRIEIHHDWCNEPVVINTEEGMVSLRVADGNATADITLTPKEARSIGMMLKGVAEEAER